jgi:multiple antibiotic resistance protein
MKELPWGTLWSLLFMTMGPIRAVSVFSSFGASDDAPGVKALATRASALVAGAFVLTVVVGSSALLSWGVSFPVLIGTGGLILAILSLQGILEVQSNASTTRDAAGASAAEVAFPGLFPPIAVAIPLIFAVPFPGYATKAGIIAMGLGLILLNWLLMRRSKAIMRTIGPVPLQLMGAVFGVLQLALAIEFIVDAFRML